jgi:hypothetical protein
MRYAQSFAYQGFTINVQCDDAAHLAWLVEFLVPSFSLVDNAQADCVVCLTEDDQSFAATRRRGPTGIPRFIDCFVLDSQVVRLPLWDSDKIEQVLFDERFQVFYWVARTSSRVRILTAANNIHARFALMRVVREFAMSHVRTPTSLVLHGAAVGLGERGLVIAGPKRAGKTSLLIYCLQAPGAQFIANDRIVVDLRARQPVLHSMPTLVTIRDRTLDFFPAVEQGLKRHCYDHRLSLAEVECEGRDLVPLGRGPSVDLSPAQFCAVLTVARRGYLPAHAVLFPQVTEDDGGIRAYRLSPYGASTYLTTALFGEGTDQGRSQVFTVPSQAPEIDACSVMQCCAALAEKVPCFVCELGRQAYRPGSALEAFVGRVLAG